MKYFLKNIAQNSLPRTIIFIVLGVAMWIPTLLSGNGVVTVVATMVLVGINAIVMMTLFRKLKVMNLPSAFVGTTYWVVISSISMLHGCWQGQVVATGIMTAYCILQTINYQVVPVEQSFVSSLIIAATSIILPESIVLIALLWGVLIFRGVMSIKVWLASLIGIATVAIYIVIAYLFGMIEMPFSDIFSTSHWQIWIAIGIMIITFIVNLLPFRFPSVLSGVIYILTICCALGYGIWNHVENFIL